MLEYAHARISDADVRRLCGDIDDVKVAEIVKTGATAQELEEAFACLHGNNDLLAEAQRPLSGRAAQIYDILTPEVALDEEA